jgi:hypothetical protein
MDLAFEHAIKHPERLCVRMEDGSTSFGISQDWLPSRWMRRAGCGPCTASGIFFYLSRKDPALEPLCPFADPEAQTLTREQSVCLVSAVWKHLTPGNKGVNTVQMFLSGAMGYAHQSGVALTPMDMHIPGIASRYSPISEYVDFIQQGLEDDCPVAFLNLSNGAETNLDGWHWVTVVSLRRDPGDAKVLLEIADDTKKKTVDFKKWFGSTFLGGALAWFKG